ncbi:MAG TPA: alkaline phosphatase family protein, partial [Candidatus Polarisedimenticolia bacterium]|nr:alkaline phosphatase family protein [Candidatus Polarisedimenticolia bacterium]
MLDFRNMHRGLGLGALLLAAGLAGARAGDTSPAPLPTTTTGVRLVVIGLDGADWQIARPMIEAGKLPNLARLAREGSSADMRSLTPTLSPLLWTTIATGKPPEQHGIIDFLVRDARTRQMVPISSTFRKVPALWNIYTRAGRTADFIAWWATWPAETINGHLVSDRFAYSMFGYQHRPEDTLGMVHPPELLGKIEPLRVTEAQIKLSDLRRFAPITAAQLAEARRAAASDPEQAYADPINHLVRILASARTYHAVALDLLDSGKPDILAVYYQGIDEVCHRFAEYIPPKLPWVDAGAYERFKNVVGRYYEYQDEQIGEILKKAGPGVTTVVLSDHGFLNGSDRPDFPPDIDAKAGQWHRLYGMMVAQGPPIRPGRLEPVSLYDVAPTLLYLSGLPVPADMPGRPIMAAVTPEFQAAFRLSTIATYEEPGGERAGAGQEPAGGSAAIDAEILRKLRSLGYVASGETTPEPEGSEGLPAASITNLVNTAALQLSSRDYAAAESSARALLSKYPENFDGRSILSEALERQGRFDEAFAEARAGLNQATEPAERLTLRYARLARRLGRLDEAREFFLRAAQLRPGRGEPWLGLGTVQTMTGDLAAAETSLLRALQIDPRSTGAVNGLFGLHERGGRSDELLKGIEAAVRANPDSSSHRTLLGLIYLKRGDTQRAEPELRKAIELAPDSDTALAGLGD